MKKLWGAVVGVLVFATAAYASMIVHGQLIDAAAENLASDPTSVTGRFYLNTTGHTLKFYTGSAWRTIVDTTTALSNPMTTTGDIIYSSDGSGTAARLAIGASTTVLHGGTTPAYSAVVNGDFSGQLSAAHGGTGVNSTATFPSSGVVVTEGASETLTSKTLTTPVIAALSSSTGTTTFNTSGAVTVPNVTDTLVSKTSTDTLTNKTLTGNLAANLINSTGQLNLNSSGTVTIPNVTDTLVGKGSPAFTTHVDVTGAATLTSTASCSGSLVDLYTVNNQSELASAGDCVQYKVVVNHGNAAEASAYVNACRAGSTIYGISLGVYAQASGSGAIAVTGNGTGTAKIQYAAVGCGSSYVELIGKTIN